MALADIYVSIESAKDIEERLNNWLTSYLTTRLLKLIANLFVVVNCWDSNGLFRSNCYLIRK